MSGITILSQQDLRLQLNEIGDHMGNARSSALAACELLDGSGNVLPRGIGWRLHTIGEELSKVLEAHYKLIDKVRRNGGVPA